MEKIKSINGRALTSAKKYLGYAKTGFDYVLKLVRENAGYATWAILVLAILVIAGAF